MHTTTNTCKHQRLLTHTHDRTDLPNDGCRAPAPFSALLLCQLKGEKVSDQSAVSDCVLYVCALSVVCVCTFNDMQIYSAFPPHTPHSLEFSCEVSWLKALPEFPAASSTKPYTFCDIWPHRDHSGSPGWVVWCRWLSVHSCHPRIRIKEKRFASRTFTGPGQHPKSKMLMLP